MRSPDNRYRRVTQAPIALARAPCPFGAAGSVPAVVETHRDAVVLGHVHRHLVAQPGFPEQHVARLGRDVLNKKPDWMTLSCGVNDVWHGKRGVSLDDYKVNITKIVDQCQSAGVKVMILTSTMIGEDQGHANNKKLATYNDFLKELAREKKCLLADLNADMQAAIAARTMQVMM